jgi:hypothetical protein
MPCHRTCARRACVCPPSSAVDSTWSAGRARTFAATRACGRADRRRRSTPRASWRREGTARAVCRRERCRGGQAWLATAAASGGDGRPRRRRRRLRPCAVADCRRRALPPLHGAQQRGRVFGVCRCPPLPSLLWTCSADVVRMLCASAQMVYWGMPYLFARRRGSVPGAAVPQRQARFNKAFPATSQTAAVPRMQCAICIENLRPGNLKRRLKCRHEFHKSCIDRWIDEGANRCPLCNKACLPPAR